jgi:methyl-accepting chemotaxis protein
MKTVKPLFSFRTMKLQNKLHLSFSVIAVLIALTAGTGLYFTTTVSKSVDVFTDVSSPMVEQISALNSDTQQMHAKSLQALQLRQRSEVNALEQEVSALEEKVTLGFETVQALIGENPDIRLDEARAEFGRFASQAHQLLEAQRDRIAQQNNKIKRAELYDQQSVELTNVLREFSKQANTTMFDSEEAIRTMLESGEYQNVQAGDIEILLDSTFGRAYPLVVAAARVQAYLTELQTLTSAYANERDPKNLDAIDQKFRKTLTRINDELGIARNHAQSAGAKAAISEVREKLSYLQYDTTNEYGLFAAQRKFLEDTLDIDRITETLAAMQASYQRRLDTVLAAAQAINGEVKRDTDQSVKTALLSIGAIGGLGVFLGLAFGFLLARGISRPVRHLTEIFRRVAGGDHDVAIEGQDRGDEIGELAQTLSSFLDTSVRATQSQSALQVASANFMITDAEGCIVSLNESVMQMFRDAEADLKTELEEFDPDQLLGGRFETLIGAGTLAQIEAEIARALESDRAGNAEDADGNEAEDEIGDVEAADEAETELPEDGNGPADSARLAVTGQERRIVIGHRRFDLTVTPVINARGKRLGSAVEWKDMTQQLATEDEVAGIVTAAGMGNFSHRLDEKDKQGFMLELAKGINQLIDAVEQGLAQTVKIMAALAEGDLTARMEGNHKGEFRKLQDYSNQMGDQMDAIVGRIAGVSSTVKQATDEISTGIADLSTRTEHQASSLEEITASMEELSATVRQNADNAQDADKVASGARDSAVESGQVVDRAVTAMNSIEGSFHEISDIVGLIQEIAFQTNLLALNASVEAARAGEAGRGFAVVANEVRALAQRTATASKDIRELIGNSDNLVQEGVTLVNDAGGALEEIVASVRKVAEYVADIAAASQEQTGGIDQVSNSITNMDEMTQQNAALVEETTAAIQSAQTQSNDLQQAVGFFRTADQPHNAETGAQGESGESPPDDAAGAQRQAPARRMAAPTANAAAAALALDEDDWLEF